MADTSELTLTPDTLRDQGNRLQTLADSYNNLFSQMKSLTKEINECWGSSMQAAMQTNLNYAYSAFDEMYTMLSQGAQLAIKSAENFEGTDKELAKLINEALANDEDISGVTGVDTTAGNVEQKGSAKANAEQDGVGMTYIRQGKSDCGLTCMAMIATSLGIESVTDKNGNANTYEGLKNKLGNQFSQYGLAGAEGKFVGMNSNHLSQEEMRSTLDEALENYQNDPDTYSPPMISVDQKNGGSNHYIIIIGKNDDGTYIVVDPSSDNPDTEKIEGNNGTVFDPITTQANADNRTGACLTTNADGKTKTYHSYIKSVTQFKKTV